MPHKTVLHQPARCWPARRPGCPGSAAHPAGVQAARFVLVARGSGGIQDNWGHCMPLVDRASNCMQAWVSVSGLRWKGKQLMPPPCRASWVRPQTRPTLGRAVVPLVCRNSASSSGWGGSCKSSRTSVQLSYASAILPHSNCHKQPEDGRHPGGRPQGP